MAYTSLCGYVSLNIYIYIFTHMYVYTIYMRSGVARLDTPGELGRTWYVAAKMAVVFCEVSMGFLSNNVDLTWFNNEKWWNGNI